jgi:hypothetical protein
MLLDQQSGFGAVAEDVLHAIGDDFGRTPTILFSMAPAAAPPRSAAQVCGVPTVVSSIHHLHDASHRVHSSYAARTHCFKVLS